MDKTFFATEKRFLGSLRASRAIKNLYQKYCIYLVYTVENSTLNRDSTFNRTVCLIESTTEYRLSSMTSLLTHTVAHSTRPSFRPKTNNQPLKKFLSLKVS